jgi:hypothetical protein
MLLPFLLFICSFEKFWPAWQKKFEKGEIVNLLKRQSGQIVTGVSTKALELTRSTDAVFADLNCGFSGQPRSSAELTPA